MSVRRWAVGVASTAAVVVGLVGIQSGIPGTAALPILPHRAVAPAAPAGGAELPAPAEVSAPPPSTGTVHRVSVVRAEAAPAQRYTDRPAKRVGLAKKPGKSDNDDGDKAGESPGHDSGKGSGHESDHGSGTKSGTKSGTDSSGGPGQG